MKFTVTDVSKSDDIDRPEDVDLDEEDLDFEPSDYEYVVFLFGYDKDYNITDFEKQVKTFKDSEEAENYAASLYDDPSLLKDYLKDLPAEVKVIGIEVETIVDFGDHAENVESIFNRKIELEK